jgi:hypothetical protein
VPADVGDGSVQKGREIVRLVVARLICTIEETFCIAGAGLIPSPSLVPQPGGCIHIGAFLLLKRPDGALLCSRIAGLAHVRRPAFGGWGVDSLLEGLRKEDVPVGTEIWTVDTPQESTNV